MAKIENKSHLSKFFRTTVENRYKQNINIENQTIKENNNALNPIFCIESVKVEKIYVDTPFKNKISEKAFGPYWIDYPEYEAFVDITVDYIGFISDGTYTYAHNDRDTLPGSFAVAYSRYDSMVVTTDYTTFQEIPSSNVISLNVDSIFVYVLHKNNSGSNDTLNISMLGLDAARRPDNSNVLWDTTIVTDTSLTSSNGGVLGFAPNIQRTGPNWGYAIKVEYNDPSLIDTFALVFYNSYSDIGSPFCIPAVFYPVSFYQVNTDNTSANSQIYPLVNGDFYWYEDCNIPYDYHPGPPASYNKEQNIIKYWATRSKVTLTHNLGVEEQEGKGMHVVSYPNPVKDVFQIKYNLQMGGDVLLTVKDISGKVQLIRNLGYHTIGSYNTQIDVAEFTSGVYFYTLEVGKTKITRRFVVVK